MAQEQPGLMGNISFIDIPENSFPFTVYGKNADTGEIIWTREVTGPGALEVPARPKDVRDVSIRIEFPDGMVLER